MSLEKIGAKRTSYINITDENQNHNKVVVLLALPLIFEQLSFIIVQYVDAIMVGGLGAYATAAIGINSSFLLLIGGLEHSLAVGAGVQLATAVGAGDKKKVYDIISNSFRLALILGAVLSFAICIWGHYVPKTLAADADVLPAASSYIRIVGGAAVFQTLSITMASILRAAGNTKVPFYIGLTANLLNAVGNFFLIPASRIVKIAGIPIFFFGADLGVSGAALSTAFSMIVSCVTLIIYLIFNNSDFRLRIDRLLNNDSKIIKSIIEISLPVSFERIALAAGHIGMTAMVSGLGTVQLATNYIVYTMATISYEVAIGFATATTTLVAQSVGAAKKLLAYSYIKKCLGLGVGLSVFISVAVILLSPSLIIFFNKDREVQELALFLLKMDAFTEPFFAVAMILCGAFRAYKDTGFPFKLTFFGVFVVRIVLGYIFAYILKLDLFGIWIAIVTDILLRAFICVYRFIVKKY